MENIPQTVEEYRAWWRAQKPHIPYGSCWCDCGQNTSPARQRDRKANYFRDEPMRYVKGHGNVKSRIFSDNYSVTNTGFQTPCWLWNRYCFSTGYGCLYERGTGRPLLAHRVFFEHYKNPIPPDKELDHLCRQPSCVRPDHLEAVSTAINQQRGNAAKLNPHKVRLIRHLRKRGMSYQKLGDLFGVARETARKADLSLYWRNI